MGTVIEKGKRQLLISITQNGSLQFSTWRILNAKNSKLNETEGAAEFSYYQPFRRPTGGIRTSPAQSALSAEF